MTTKEPEPKRLLDVPVISPKTSREQVQEYSKLRWRNDGRSRIAADIVKNGKELLAGSNINWELVLESIRREQLGSASYGEAAIIKYDAHLIGGLAVGGAWAMHDPPTVYLSGRLLAERAKSSRELEDFKRRMQRSAIDYGQKVLPHANLYIEILDFLLGVEDRNRHRKTINRLQDLLGNGYIEEGYEIMKSRDDLVRRRGEESSSNTTSSILTPPKLGI